MRRPSVIILGAGTECKADFSEKEVEVDKIGRAGRRLISFQYPLKLF
jgi:hypothetical protein